MIFNRSKKLKFIFFISVCIILNGCMNMQSQIKPQSTLIATSSISTPIPSPTSDKYAAVLAIARKKINEAYGIEPQNLIMRSINQVNWPDSCLGVTKEDVFCLQVITPGYRIVLESEQQQFVLHTDLAGRSAVVTK